MIQNHPLKAFDAIQLAVALHYQQVLSPLQINLIFVSGDKALNTAAQVEGLAVDDPFRHIAPSDQI